MVINSESSSSIISNYHTIVISHFLNRTYYCAPKDVYGVEVVKVFNGVKQAHLWTVLSTVI